MDSLRDRHQGAEARFTLDQDQAFRARTRRARLFGHWVAEQARLTPSDAVSYGRTMVELALERVDFSACIDRAQADLAARGIEVSRRTLEEQADLLLQAALAQRGSDDAPVGRA